MMCNFFFRCSTVRSITVISDKAIKRNLAGVYNNKKISVLKKSCVTDDVGGG